MEQDRVGKGQAPAKVAVLAAVDSARAQRQEPVKDKAQGKAGREAVWAVVVEAWDAVRGVAK